MVKSLLESFEYFKDFLENTSKRMEDCGKIEVVEREIRNVVNEAEDAIELEI